jgi:hypothetical protein
MAWPCIVGRLLAPHPTGATASSLLMASVTGSPLTAMAGQQQCIADCSEQSSPEVNTLAASGTSESLSLGDVKCTPCGSRICWTMSCSFACVGHHHAPGYQTPASVQQQCDLDELGEDEGSCVCASAGMNKANPWRGESQPPPPVSELLAK